MDYDKSKIEILSADGQASYKGGFLVLVTGYITMAKDKVKRTFTQSFFLAPQEKGYYVHNDIFRYVEDEISAPPSPTVATEEDVQVVDVPVIATPGMLKNSPFLGYCQVDCFSFVRSCLILIAVAEPTQVSAELEIHDDPQEVEDVIASIESDQSVENGADSVPEEEIVVNSSAEVNPKEVAAVLPSPPVTQEAIVPLPASPASQADAPKMSYAAMVNNFFNVNV